MPKYTFTCDFCGDQKTAYTSSKTQHLPCISCGTVPGMRRELPSSGSQEVREVVDSYTNVRLPENQKEEMKARKTEHFWEVEVPRLVQTYSIETCLQEGWLVYNEKGELVIGKSPSKR
jgi:transcription elongation factor Elf1